MLHYLAWTFSRRTWLRQIAEGVERVPFHLIGNFAGRPLFFAFTRLHDINRSTDDVCRYINSSHHHIFGHTDCCSHDATTAEERQQENLREFQYSYFHFLVPIEAKWSSLQGNTSLPTPCVHEFRPIRLAWRHFRPVIHDYFPTKSVI